MPLACFAMPASTAGRYARRCLFGHEANDTDRSSRGDLFAHALPALTALAGYYPGDRLGFAGREAGQVMRDWAATVRSGRYLAYGGDQPLDEALAGFTRPVLGLRFSHDWLVPEASLQELLAKLGAGEHTVESFDDTRLGAVADHFRWMRRPDAVAARVAAWMRLSS